MLMGPAPFVLEWGEGRSGRGTLVKIPDTVLRALLAESELSPIAKIVWQATAKCLPQGMNEVPPAAGVSRSSAFKACRQLASYRWMSFVKTDYRVRPLARIPYEHQVKMAEDFEALYKLVRNRGEFLMKTYLDMRVLSDEYVDNARFGFLINPETDEPLEYDRYYTSKVAFEFNGPQHHGPTEMYPNTKASKETNTRDLVKKALSHDANVNLVTVEVEDLVPDAFDKLLPADLALNDIDRDGPYFRAFARLCSAYVAKAAAGGAAATATKATARK